MSTYAPLEVVVIGGRSREKIGTGLGRAIVKQLAEAMGGTASVSSEVGKGARFVVELAAATVAAASAAGTAAA